MKIKMTHGGKSYYVGSYEIPLLKRSPHPCHAVEFKTIHEARLYWAEHKHQFMGEVTVE